MATFEIKTKHSINVKGEYIDGGLAIQISSMFANPLDEKEKVHNAFIRIHGLDLKTEGYLNPGFLEYSQIYLDELMGELDDLKRSPIN